MAITKLTEKQEAYCQARAISHKTQIDSYKIAYGAENMSANAIYVAACKMEKLPKISLRIKTLQTTVIDAVIDKGIVTKEYVIERLMEVAERCMQRTEVLDNLGHPTGEWKFEAAGANRSLELLGKTMAMFTDKMDVTGKLIMFEGEELDD